jgi:hypothetical protein
LEAEKGFFSLVINIDGFLEDFSGITTTGGRDINSGTVVRIVGFESVGTEG